MTLRHPQRLVLLTPGAGRGLKFARIATAEGITYLGFLFAYAETASQVEERLRQAHQFLDFEIMETLRVVSR